MKKNVLALSISAAVCSLGLVGAAHAITDLGVAASVGNATSLKVNPDGIGHNVIVPYYTAQGTNATLINLVNHANVAKAVKVRFRGASNSDDVLDFQVFLSPYDMWTAKISKSATGEAQIETSDVSCTKPAFTAGVPQKFGTGRLDTSLDAAGKQNGTREGYVEIFNMADIPATYTAAQVAAAAPVVVFGAANALATAVTHVKGVAPCTAATMALLDTDKTNAALQSAGLDLPTTGLSANWTIVNTVTGAAYGGRAMAVHALLAGAAVNGNLVYWPQTPVAITANTEIRGFTADPLLTAGPAAAAGAPVGFVGTPVKAGLLTALMQDLPDMSTPYIALPGQPVGAYNVPAIAANIAGVEWAAVAQAATLTRALAATTVSNEYYTDASAATAVGAATDWVFSMPTRRYNVAFDYAGGAPVYTKYAADMAGTATVAGAGNYDEFFTAANTEVVSRVVCVNGITPTTYNREETTPAGAGVTFSPSSVSAVSFCGETGVWAINKTAPTESGVLGSTLTVKGVDTTYTEGWMNVATPGLTGAAAANIGLPVIGVAYTKAASNPTMNFGVNTDHRVGRIVGYTY